MKKVLVIDDEEFILSSLKRMLALLEYEATTCKSPKEALGVISDNEFDFILLDFLMPKTTGAWFLKKANIPRETKVLLMTSYVNKDIISEMFKLGACGYLIKPFDEKELSMHFNFHKTAC